MDCMERVNGIKRALSNKNGTRIKLENEITSFVIQRHSAFQITLFNQTQLSHVSSFFYGNSQIRNTRYIYMSFRILNLPVKADRNTVFFFRLRIYRIGRLLYTTTQMEAYNEKKNHISIQLFQNTLISKHNWVFPQWLSLNSPNSVKNE